jgi:hypothetical protein
LKKYFNLGCFNIGFNLIQDILKATELAKRKALAGKLKRYKDTRWDQFYPKAEKFIDLQELIESIVKSFEYMVKASDLQIENLDK